MGFLDIYARTLAELELKDHFNFGVEMVLNPTRQEMLAALRSYGGKMESLLTERSSIL